jgi:hypothetical protein
MNLYVWSLAAGGLGLVAMAVSGVGRHGHGGGVRHGGARHGPAHPHAGGARHQAGPSAHQQGPHGPHSPGAPRAARASLAYVLSPRVLFSLLVGAGASGLAAQTVLTEPFVFGVAVAGGIAFERLLVTPVWNFLLKFASEPALSLESAIADEARAITGFDAEGHGMIAVELDGRVVQVLGTLRPEDRAAGIQVRAGDTVRIEEVDDRRNRCTVSFVA